MQFSTAVLALSDGGVEYVLIGGVSAREIDDIYAGERLAGYTQKE